MTASARRPHGFKIASIWIIIGSALLMLAATSLL